MGSPIGMWTSVSGSVAQNQALDVAANNLANVNTVGFKKDQPTFKEYLTTYERPPSPELDIPQTVFKDSDFYHHDGREHAMVNMSAVVADHSAGTLRQTNAPFDMAIEGPGFFTVQTPSGAAYTRAGDFKIDGSGFLVTTDGYKVLGAGADAAAAGGNAPAAGALAPINLGDAMAGREKVRITGDGKIFSGADELFQLAIAEFADPALLQKQASTLYSNPNGSNIARPSENSRVHQGFLEGSNVNAVSEIMNVIKANRLFESNMRAVKAYGDMAGKEANEVGKL